MKEAKLADALKAITGNPDVEDAFVEAATYMRTVKGAKEAFEKEAKTIPGLESRIQELEENLGTNPPMLFLIHDGIPKIQNIGENNHTFWHTPSGNTNLQHMSELNSYYHFRSF